MGGILSGKAGRPETIRGNKEPITFEAEGTEPRERYSVFEDSVGREEDKDVQEFLEGKGGKETPGIGTGQIKQILESISDLASSTCWEVK